ncbi:TRAP transporter large permease [Synergistes jonesii]|uniref:TRAP transporter large permease n=1 Tax=Synergistes jonesii TaxID=2754 RepID=UPI0033340233
MEFVVIGIGILVLCLVIGMPIPFSFATTFIWLAFSLDYQTDFLLSAGYNQLNSVVLLAIPLFILAGGIMEKSKIGTALIGVVETFTGHMRSSLGMISVVACAIFGSISGSASATLSCIGSMMEPRMTAAGYDKGYTASLLAAACPLGLLIPPSSAQILYAWSSNQSVLACFLATVGPGILLTILLCITNAVIVRRMNIKVAPKQTADMWVRNSVKNFKFGIPALIMPVIILGSIYGGIMTPTEAAAASVLYAIPVGIYFYKGLTYSNLRETVVDTSCTTGVIMVMFFMVMIMSRLLVMEDVPQSIADALLGLTDNKALILLLVNIFMIIIGMLMDDVSGILLCTPILLPIVTALGVHPVHFAAILGVNLGMGNITPPTAPMLYLSGRICSAKINKMLTPIMILIIFAYVPTLVVTTYWPALSLTLPKLILPKIFGM